MVAFGRRHEFSHRPLLRFSHLYHRRTAFAAIDFVHIEHSSTQCIPEVWLKANRCFVRVLHTPEPYNTRVMAVQSKHTCSTPKIPFPRRARIPTRFITFYTIQILYYISVSIGTYVITIYLGVIVRFYFDRRSTE